MAFTNDEKLMAILRLKKVIADAKDKAGVVDLGEMDTDAAALQTAFDADPATVTATMLTALRTKIEGLTFNRVDSGSELWTEVASEYAIENP